VSRLRRRGKNGTTVFFAVIDKTRPASEANPDGRAAALSVEGSFLIVLPPFQRTHVATHAVGLFLHYALDTPDEGGLGLRRVQWQADPSSTASLNAAQRVGFRKEGTLRWASFVVDGDERGKMYNRRGCPPYGDPKARGRGSVYFSMCWDDSLERKRELVDERMAK
jgi:RimJ/RimL family protein N-acetyltransferase